MKQEIIDLLKKRMYLKDGENDWCDICNRVAKSISSIEKTEKEKQEIYEQIYNSMLKQEFIFGSPVLLNANKNNTGQLSSCFLVETKDNIEAICQTDAEITKIFQKNGGAGMDLSVLRPAKTKVNQSNGYSGGIVGFAYKYNNTTDVMTRNNMSKRGALKINLNCWHPDIIEFIHCKDDITQLNFMNISISITDNFMKAIENNEDWDLIFPDYEKCKDVYDKEWDGDIEKWINNNRPIKVYDTVKARKLYMDFIKSSWSTGEPGVNFQDTMNRGNPNKHLSTMIYTNPCSEFSNISYASCNLGSINLNNLVVNKDNKNIFDWDKLAEISFKSIRWFDNLIAINKLPIQKIQQVTEDIRPIGLGFFGLADCMYKLGIKYNSQEGIDFADTVIKTMWDNALKATQELAEERGVYNKYNNSEWDKRGIKVRNSCLLSIAPTGSISFLCNTSGGVEPNYALLYTRKTSTGETFDILNPIFEEKIKELNLNQNDIVDKLKKDNGSCQNIKEIPENIRDIFVIASDITPKEHVDMVAIIQNTVDTSLSKTVNFSNNASEEDIADIYIYAWEKGLKGVTVYRDGCRDNQTLSTSTTAKTTSKTEKIINTFKPNLISPITREELGKTYGTTVKKKVACGNLYITINRDKNNNIIETFVHTSKNGICKSNIDALNRQVSLNLRSGVKVTEVIDQLSNIQCQACARLLAKGQKVDGLSCSDTISKALKEEYESNIKVGKCDIENCDNCNEVMEENKTDVGTIININTDNKIMNHKEKCPECGEKGLIFTSGCSQCTGCGYTKCN